MKNRKTRSAMRRMLFTLALVLVVAVASVGGTIAWLTDKTDAVTNTFTVGDINITLTETTGTEYKIIPGTDLSKDPKVTVKADSEACYVFVKVKEENWPTVKETVDDKEQLKVRYSINTTNWTKLEVTGLEAGESVYYKVFDNAITTDTDLSVLANDKVYVSENLTKDEAAAIKTVGTPKLTFTAYAVQKDNINSAADAWSKVSGT